MKKIKLLICCLVLINLAFGQIKNNLTGKWQAESKELTSMNLDTYQFLNNGRFTFEPDGYNGLNRIISISGRYKIKGDTLLLTPEFTKEITGGYPVRSESTTLSDTWEIIQGQIKTFSCKKRLCQPAIIKINPDNKTFTLDERKFFKLDE